MERVDPQLHGANLARVVLRFLLHDVLQLLVECFQVSCRHLVLLAGLLRGRRRNHATGTSTGTGTGIECVLLLVRIDVSAIIHCGSFARITRIVTHG